MDASTWQIISIIGFSLSGLCLIAAVIIFIKFNIFYVIGDLSGKLAAKQIQAMREQNALSGEKKHTPGLFNVERGPLTDVSLSNQMMGASEQAMANQSKRLDATERISSPTQVKTDVLVGNHETEYLEENHQTELLKNQTDVLNNTENENITMILTQTMTKNGGTQVLSEFEHVVGTTVLSQEDIIPTNEINFVTTRNIVVIHAKEVIE